MKRIRVNMNKERQKRNHIDAILHLLINPITLFWADPLLPRVISFQLSKTLKQLKNNGILEGYKLEVQRTGRLCYKLHLHVSAKKKETNKLLINYVSKLLGRA